jgi:SAM-dependent methyltransferase
MPIREELVVPYSAEWFDEEYFRTGLGPRPYERGNSELIQFFCSIAEELIRALHPRRVLDAGCAMGFLVEAFWDRGVVAHGVDISPYAISQVRRDMQTHCRVASVDEPIEGSYDLVTCIEVLEHMPWDLARKAIENLTRISDTILFSSSPTDLKEPTHINVNPPIVWLEEFGRAGFYPDLLFDAAFIAPQAMLLCRKERPLEWESLNLYANLRREKIQVSTLAGALTHTTQLLNDMTSAKQQLETTVARTQGESEQICAFLKRLAELSAILQSEAPGEKQHAAVMPQSGVMPLEAILEELLQVFSRFADQANSSRDSLHGLSKAVEKIQTRVDAIANLQDGASGRDSQLSDLESELATLRQQIVIVASRSASNETADYRTALEEVKRDLAENRQAISQLIRITTDLHNREQNVADQVHDMLNGRIWRTLSRTGRFVLKMVGRS